MYMACSFISEVRVHVLIAARARYKRKARSNPLVATGSMLRLSVLTTVSRFVDVATQVQAAERSHIGTSTPGTLLCTAQNDG